MIVEISVRSRSAPGCAATLALDAANRTTA
jgi:hypothetical protein